MVLGKSEILSMKRIQINESKLERKWLIDKVLLIRIENNEIKIESTRKLYEL